MQLLLDETSNHPEENNQRKDEENFLPESWYSEALRDLVQRMISEERPITVDKVLGEIVQMVPDVG